MRIIPALLVASVGSLAFAGAVAAQSLPVRTMTVQLPGGGLEEIHYAGDVPPQVAFLPGPPSPFAALERLSFAMDREAAAMLRGALPMMALPLAGPDQLIPIASGNLPPGARSYGVVVTLSPTSFCSQSMEIISAGPGARPRVVRRGSGNCGPGTSVAMPHAAPVALPPQRSNVLSARAEPAKPSASLMREAVWQSRD